MTSKIGTETPPDDTEVEGESPFDDGDIDPNEGLQSGWDEGVHEETERKLIPKSRYDCVITKVALVLSDEKPYQRRIDVTASIGEYPMPITTMFFMCNIPEMRALGIKASTMAWAEGSAQHEFNKLLLAVGLKPEFDVKKAIFLDGDTDVLMNKAFSAHIGHEKDDEFGPRERINNRTIQRAKQ